MTFGSIDFCFLRFIYLWLCWVFLDVFRFSLYNEQRLLFLVAQGFFIAVASLVAEHRVWSTGLVVVAYRLICCETCGIFLEQGLNPCSWHWQVDS